MEDQQFDRWARALTERRGRRGLGKLGAEALAAVGVGMAFPSAAKKKHKNK